MVSVRFGHRVDDVRNAICQRNRAASVFLNEKERDAMPSTQPRTAAKADLGADLSADSPNTISDSSHDNTVEMKTHKRSPKRSTKAGKRGEKVAEKNGERPKRATVRRVPRQERSKILVDCIRIAACDILQKRGPKALTTNNIAARAGVSIGSLYQYFANKEEILEEVFREQADRSFEDSRQWADWVKDLPLRDVIQLLVERSVRRHREFHSFHPEFYQRHHQELDIGLRTRDGDEETPRETYAVAWLHGVLESRVDELRIPDARLSAVALAHAVSATLHGLVENEQHLLYDDELSSKLTSMVCGLVLRAEPAAEKPDDVQPQKNGKRVESRRHDQLEQRTG